MVSSKLNNFFLFQKIVFKPGIHIVFSVFWFASLKAAILLCLPQNTWEVWEWQDLIAILTLYLVQFFIRIADEIKDYSYDVIHNPERPLVQNKVSRADLNVYMIMIGIFAVGINLLFSWTIVLLVVFELIYAYLLITIEKLFPKAADNIFINLLITYPVNVTLSIYILFYVANQQNIPVTPNLFLPILAFATGFLYYEFARKTKWPFNAKDSERIYSRGLGGRGSAYVTLLLGIIAPLILIYAIALVKNFNPILFVLLLPWIPGTYGVVKFLTEGKRQGPIGTGSLYLVCFYGSLLFALLLA